MGKSGIDWSVYAAHGTTYGEGDSRKTEFIYGAWTVSISHGHGMRPGWVMPAAVAEWRDSSKITEDKAKAIRSGHKGGRPFNPDITAYGISERDMSAAILEDLFDTLGVDGEDARASGPLERQAATGGVTVTYRCVIDPSRHFVGVGTYFLEHA